MTLEGTQTTFTIDMLGVDRKNRVLQLGLTTETPDSTLGRQTKTASFTVGYSDFPMIDNTRLDKGQRCAVVLNSLSDGPADLTLGSSRAPTRA